MTQPGNESAGTPLAADPAADGPPALLIRTMRGHITLWSAAMEARYGFTSDQALGHGAQQLLRTIFWQSLPEMETTLLREHSWHGGLVHARVDGRRLMTATHWLLHHDAESGEALVSELHADILPSGEHAAGQLADVVYGVGRDLNQSVAAIVNHINTANRVLQPAWPDRQGISQALAAASEQAARMSDGMMMFRALGDVLRSLDDATVHERAVPPARRPDSN